MTLSELGTTLRTEREQRGLSIDDVAQRLRISMHVLQSLEEGNVQALPHKAYAKGFIRSYATLLGLATDEIEACVASLSGAAPSVPQPIANLDENDEPVVPAKKMLACAIVLLLLAAGGYAAWHYNLLALVPGVENFRTAQPLLPETAQPEKAQGPVAAIPKTEKRPAKTEKSEKRDTPDANIARGTAGTAQDARANREQLAATEHTSAQPQQPQRQEPKKQPQQAPTAESHVPSLPDAPVAHHKIIVTAVEDCWIQSNADHSNARQFTLRKGDTFALTFGKSLEVKLGNAAAVRIRYNGNELPQAGKEGEARTLVFPLVANQQ